jgi:hypothetical protein
MNNESEFQWRSEMRKLGGDVEPARDLWPNIAARIAAAPAATRRSRMRVAFAIAATLVLAAGTMLVVQRAGLQGPTSLVSRLTSHGDVPVSQPMPTAMDWTARPADAKLAAAARDLDDASAQLQEALEQHPDAVFLVGLLNRANGQRMRLLRQTSYTGA